MVNCLVVSLLTIRSQLWQPLFGCRAASYTANLANSQYLSAGVQPLPVRQRADVGQRFLQEVGGQEVAQHGKPQLYQEVHQALERRLVHAGDDPEGTVRNNFPSISLCDWQTAGKSILTFFIHLDWICVQVYNLAS